MHKKGVILSKVHSAALKIIRNALKSNFVTKYFLICFFVEKIEYLTLNLRYNIWTFNRRLDDNKYTEYTLCGVEKAHIINAYTSLKEKEQYIIIIHFTSVHV